MCQYPQMCEKIDYITVNLHYTYNNSMPQGFRWSWERFYFIPLDA